MLPVDPSGVKPGVQTTELWLTVLTDIVAVLNADGAVNLLPHQWGGVAAAIVTASYVISRGIAKHGAGR